MAFVQPASASSLRLSTFMQPAIETKRPSQTSVATIRMAGATEEKGAEPKVVGTAGNSEWKENVFVGGFPGGEGYFKKWISGGMTDDVPDMPSFMQPKAAFKPKKPQPRTGVLANLDRTEFFKDFGKVGEEATTAEEAGEAGEAGEEEAGEEGEGQTRQSAASSPSSLMGIVQEEDPTPSDVLGTEIPDDSVYGKFFPEATRNLAPHFFFEYDVKSKNHQYDRVGMSMSPVIASPTEVYFPKEMKNKAPVIDIFYAGAVSTASVSLSLATIEPLPTLPPPPKSKDETVVALRAGAGGGLKLDFGTASGENIPL